MKVASSELPPDSKIRLWVVLPIVIITFFMGVIRHHVSILLQSDEKLTQEQVSHGQVLTQVESSGKMENTFPVFLDTKILLNNPENGFFKKIKRNVVPSSSVTNPTMLIGMMKGNVTNVLPMILIGGWINMTFSGFVTSKLQT